MTEHRIRYEPQPIADQIMVNCSCGWREAVSVHFMDREGRSAKDAAERHLARENLRAKCGFPYQHRK